MMKVLDIDSNFLGLEREFSSYDKSEIIILQAPLEKTVSYGKGTKKGPSAILQASHYVELFDEEFQKELCFEMGICTLDAIKFGKFSIERSLDKIYKEVREHLERGKFVVTLGGEHSISASPIKAHFEKYQNLSILQIDAHSDLRDSYEGSKYSHASVMARVAEVTKNIVQVGIRAQCIEENNFINDNKIKTFYARDIRENKHGKNWDKSVLSALSENVYITFDVDGLDPSVISATGTPEPGGLFWDETISLLKLRIGILSASMLWN